MERTMKKLLPACLGLLCIAPALAHEGHGLEGSHGHATDALGFVAVAVGLALALWLNRK
jgi:hypothetical protein